MMALTPRLRAAREAHRAIEPIAIGERDGSEIQLGGALDELFGCEPPCKKLKLDQAWSSVYSILIAGSIVAIIDAAHVPMGVLAVNAGEGAVGEDDVVFVASFDGARQAAWENVRRCARGRCIASPLGR